MIVSAAKFAAVVAFVSFLLSLCERPIGNTEYSLMLGDPTYNMEDAKAPVIGGRALVAFSWLLTKTPLGHALRRHLLLDNDLTQLRELAAQMPETPPLHHPMLRLNKGQRRAHEAAVAAAAKAKIRMSDLAVFPPEHPFLTPETSDVLALHAAYKEATTTTTPSAVAAKILAAFPGLQAKYRAFSSHPLEGSIEAAAAASTARFAAGAPLSVWDGVPVAFKDMVPISGYVMTDGSASNVAENRNRTEDALMVSRFRALGALVLPPTSMTEGGVTPVGYSTYIKGARNPYDSRRYSGGSSAGSAVAVALGLAPVAIGFDGGGSIRTPASLSGVVGLATGFGRLPLSSHFTGTLIKAGPLARRTADAALAYAVLVRHSDEYNFYGEMYDGVATPEALLNDLFFRPFSSPSMSSSSRELEGLTLGVFDEWFDDADGAVVVRNREMLQELQKRGAAVKKIALPNMQQARMAHAFKITSEFAVGWDAKMGAGADLEAATRVTVALGSSTTALEVLAAEKLRRFWMEVVEGTFEGGEGTEDDGVDCIVTPTTPMVAPKIPDGFDWDRGESNTVMSVALLKYVFPGNFLGLPGVAHPIGFSDDPNDGGMPISMLFTTRQWSGEAVALRLSRVAEDIVREKGWATRVPQDRIDLLG